MRWEKRPVEAAKWEWCEAAFVNEADPEKRRTPISPPPHPETTASQESSERIGSQGVHHGGWRGELCSP
jgi:hypothetical protein